MGVNSLKYVTWKDYEAVTGELLYRHCTFAGAWNDKYPRISKSWYTHWQNLNTLFAYSADIRKAIYKTNAIESLNSVIRQATRKRKLFPVDDSVRNVIYLAIEAASRKLSMPIRGWRAAMNRFMIEFEGCLDAFI